MYNFILLMNLGNCSFSMVKVTLVHIKNVEVPLNTYNILLMSSLLQALFVDHTQGISLAVNYTDTNR